MGKYCKEKLEQVFGEIPQVVEERITKEVQKGIKGNKRKVSMRKVTVVMLAAVMVTGTVIFADNMYNYTIKRDRYMTEILKKSDQNAEDSSEFAGFDYIAIKYNYIPEGYKPELEKILNMENADPQAEITGINKLHSEDGGSISVCISVMNSNDIISQIQNTKKVEELTFDGKKAYIINKYTVESMRADKECYVFFQDSKYYAIIQTNSFVSMEDTQKFIEKCTLEGTNEPYMLDATVVSKEELHRNRFAAEGGKSETVQTKTAANQGPNWEWLFKNFHQPGETIEDNGCEFTLNSYKFIDNISEYIDKGIFSIDVKKDWFDKDGNILPSHIQIIKEGDGINTVDEVIDEKDIPVKLLVVNITVKVKENPNNQPIHVMPWLELDGFQNNKLEAGTYEVGDKKNEGAAIYNEIAIDEGEGFDYANLKVGDVVSYNLIYVVDEMDMEHVGLVFNGTKIIKTSYDLRPQQQ